MYWNHDSQPPKIRSSIHVHTESRVKFRACMLNLFTRLATFFGGQIRLAATFFGQIETYVLWEKKFIDTS